jgi:hypothetical protein
MTPPEYTQGSPGCTGHTAIGVIVGAGGGGWMHVSPFGVVVMQIETGLGVGSMTYVGVGGIGVSVGANDVLTATAISTISGGYPTVAPDTDTGEAALELGPEGDDIW